MEWWGNPYSFAGALWTPAKITTALWLDAADASTITTVSGAVSQWNDKSGNSRNATQSTSANRPAYATVTQNGLNTITFNGINSFLNIASAQIFSQGAADLSIFAAYRLKSNSVQAIFGNHTTGPFVIYAGTQAAYLTPWGIFNNVSIDIDPDAYINNLPWVIAAIRYNSVFTGWTNGAQKNSVSNAYSLGAATPWRIGIITTNEYPANMDLYELICINSAASSTIRQQIEGYLHWKWGLQASLSADHPYKSSAP